MVTQTAPILCKCLSSPDEVRTFPNGRIELCSLGEKSFARLILQPGWKWSDDVRPLVGTDSCLVEHYQYVLSGRLMIAMDDGTMVELKEGDVALIPAGHNAWVCGNEPFVAVDFSGMKEYARPVESESERPVIEADYY